MRPATPDGVTVRMELDRQRVRGAIALAAHGTYGVTMTNMPDCRELAAELRDEARRDGVELALEEREDGSADLRVHRA